MSDHTHQYFSVATPGQDGFDEVAGLIASAHSGLTFKWITRSKITGSWISPHGKNWFMFASPGAKEVRYQGANYNLLGGDLLNQSPNNQATIVTPGEPYGFLTVEVDEADVPRYRNGPTLLANLPNEFGGCCQDVGQQDSKQFRRILYSSQTAHQAPGEDVILPLEAHAPLINPSASFGHYHPADCVVGAGGEILDVNPQGEIYYVLDHTERGLEVESEGNPTLFTWEDPAQGGDPEQTQVRIGDFVYIPPGVGHHIQGALALVIALNKFYMTNEVPIGKSVDDYAASQAN